MKIIMKRILMTVLCFVMLITLCACDSGVIGTVMTIDESFAGSRVMEFDIKKSDLGGFVGGLFGAPTVDAIIQTLEENCPPEMTFQAQKNGNDAHCTLTVSFASQGDYEKKVTALLGKAPSITFVGPSEDLFTSGITFKENFSSVDLLKWASDALAAEYPRYADDISISDQKGTTVVMFNGAQYSTANIIDIKPIFTPLDRVVINTIRYGDSDYVRTVEIQISADNLALIGKDRLTEEFLLPLTADVTDISTAGWSDKSGNYVISMRQGNLEDLVRFTSSIFAGSTAEYDADSNTGAFTESGVLNETINFDGFVCRDDRTANVTMVYSTTDETTFSDSGDGVLSADKKTYTVSGDGITSESIKIISETRYIVESLNVSTSVSATGKTTVAVMIAFPTHSSRSAAELASAYFEKEFADTGINVSITSTGFAETKSEDDENASSASKYSVLFSVSGNDKEITKALTAAFGEGNTFESNTSGHFSFYKTADVKHSVNLTEIADLALYGGNIIYTFSGSFTKVQNVGWTDIAGNANNDVLAGQINKETFTDTSIPCAPFTITYQYNFINIILVGLTALLGIAFVCLLMVISSKIRKKLQGSRRKKKEDMAIEAVKTVALAIVPEEKRGELTELPPELTQRPMVVLEPRNDDGLDEDDDEPEGVQLFATTLRLLLISLAVLFFFPFCNLQKASFFDRVETISGWNLFMGKELFGVPMEAQRLTIILLIIPVVVLLLLMLRRKLPRLVIPVFVTASSLFAAFYMLQLDDTINKVVEALKANVSDVASPVYQMAYKYTIVIYVILALGGILLLFSDVSYVLSKKRRESDKQ